MVKIAEFFHHPGASPFDIVRPWKGRYLLSGTVGSGKSLFTLLTVSRKEMEMIEIEGNWDDVMRTGWQQP